MESNINIKRRPQGVLDRTEMSITTHSGKKYPLREITLEELQKLRKGKKPGFVFKTDNKFFYTQIPSSTNLMFVEGCEHLCSKGGCCARLSAAPDCDGGCQKVRDPSLMISESWYKSRAKALTKSSAIEKYVFVNEAYETFNMLTGFNVMVILACINHKVAEVRNNIAI